MYDWEDKQADCYRLYVDEKKSLDEVQDFWKERGFEPSKRAFQTQFKKWNFPSKHNHSGKNPDVLDRIKECWNQNMTQKEMLQTLHDEGFKMSDRELIRVRAKNRWLMRVRNSTAPSTDTATAVEEASIYQQLQDAIREHRPSAENDSQSPSQQLQGAVSSSSAAPSAPAVTPAQPAPQVLPTVPFRTPESERERLELLRKRQVESDERWRTRKRRRRTRGWAGLPPDPEGHPPRFPSETTLDEAKAYLNLDNEAYGAMRDQFMAMCDEEGVVKKTLCGPEKWDALKNRLIRENPHLQSAFWGAPANRAGDQRDISLDVICTDVTKRIRVMRSRMSLAEAKNVLSINPTESREIRQDFHELIVKANFTSKLEADGNVWEDLKRQLISESDILKRIFAAGTDDPRHDLKAKAFEMICRDVMKRIRDERHRANPSRTTNAAQTTPGPGPAKPCLRKNKKTIPTSAVLGLETQVQTPARPTASRYLGFPQNDLQIDPSLLLAANDHQRSTAQPVDPALGGVSATSRQTAANSASPIPAYFRLHPQSQVQTAPQLWLGALQNGTVDEIHFLATKNHISTRILGVEGVVKGNSKDAEIRYTIDDEEELGGYLAHVAGGKVTFVVNLAYL